MGKRGPLPRKRLKIADWVRREIVKGTYREGERLPDSTPVWGKSARAQAIMV